MVDAVERASTIAADAGRLARMVDDGDHRPVETVETVDSGRPMASAFDVDRLLGSSAAYCATQARGPDGPPVDLAHVRSFCTTHVTVAGEPVPTWAELSGVYEDAAGRHLQIHCNFPHHAAGVVKLLDCPDDRDGVAAAIAERDAFELETDLIDAGMVGAAVRTLDEWRQHPHALATAGQPPITVEQIGDADPSPATGPTGDRPMRVLDCSRVLAGPVAGQLLAAVGGDVMRLGADHLPSVEIGVIATGFGKRNAFADLRRASGRAAMTDLLAGADVWIDAFRPGAFEAHGFTPERAAELRPGIVVVQISAFDRVGPWSGRRGFDSIVQSTTGVRWAGGEFAVDESGRRTASGPVGLPVQALDYATGFLAAGVAAQLERHRRRVGGSWLARLSLLRTRDWLVSMGGPSSFTPSAVSADARHLHSADADVGRVTAVMPFIGEPRHAPRRLGTSEPIW